VPPDRTRWRPGALRQEVDNQRKTLSAVFLLAIDRLERVHPLAASDTPLKSGNRFLRCGSLQPGGTPSPQETRQACQGRGHVVLIRVRFRRAPITLLSRSLDWTLIAIQDCWASVGSQSPPTVGRDWNPTHETVNIMSRGRPSGMQESRPIPGIQQTESQVVVARRVGTPGEVTERTVAVVLGSRWQPGTGEPYPIRDQSS
jgi:hypothetical protein